MHEYLQEDRRWAHRKGLLTYFNLLYKPLFQTIEDDLQGLTKV